MRNYQEYYTDFQIVDKQNKSFWLTATNLKCIQLPASSTKNCWIAVHFHRVSCHYHSTIHARFRTGESERGQAMGWLCSIWVMGIPIPVSAIGLPSWGVKKMNIRIHWRMMWQLCSFSFLTKDLSPGTFSPLCFGDNKCQIQCCYHSLSCWPIGWIDCGTICHGTCGKFIPTLRSAINTRGRNSLINSNWENRTDTISWLDGIFVLDVQSNFITNPFSYTWFKQPSLPPCSQPWNLPIAPPFSYKKRRPSFFCHPRYSSIRKRNGGYCFFVLPDAGDGF